MLLLHPLYHYYIDPITDLDIWTPLYNNTIPTTMFPIPLIFIIHTNYITTVSTIFLPTFQIHTCPVCGVDIKLDDLAKHQRHHDLLEVRLEAQTPPLAPHGFASRAEAIAALHAGEVPSTSTDDSPELTTASIVALTEPALPERPEAAITELALPETTEATITASPGTPEAALTEQALPEAAMATEPALPETPEATESVAPTRTLDLTMLNVFAAPTEPAGGTKAILRPASPDNTGSTIECINLSGSPELGSPTSSVSYVTLTSSDEEVVKFQACYLTSP